MPRMITCPECGATCEASHGRQKYCSNACLKSSRVMAAKRGQMAMALLQTWRMERNDKDLQAYAWRELCDMVAAFNREDKERGADPRLVIAADMAAQRKSVDRVH